MTSKNPNLDTKETSGSERGGSGNFANDPQRASEAGKKGGKSHSGSHTSGGSRSTDDDAMASRRDTNDSDTDAEPGRRGGSHSHGGTAK